MSVVLGEPVEVAEFGEGSGRAGPSGKGKRGRPGLTRASHPDWKVRATRTYRWLRRASSHFYRRLEATADGPRERIVSATRRRTGVGACRREPSAFGTPDTAFRGGRDPPGR